MPLFLWGTVMFMTQVASAQSDMLKLKDSLQHLISNSTDDVSKIENYDALNRLLLKLNDRQTLLEKAEEGLILSEKLGISKWIVQMTLYKAIAIDISGRPDEAIPIYMNGLEMAKLTNEKELEAKYYMNIGACYYYIGDLHLGLKNYLDAYERSEALKKVDFAKLLNNIGIIYRLQKKHLRAEEIYLKSYRLKEELQDSLGMATSLMNLGLVNYRIKGKERKAIDYLKKSYLFYEKLKRPYDMASCSTSLGEVYLALQNIPAAKKELRKAWRYFEENPSKLYSISTLNLLSQIAVLEKDYELADTHLEKALELVADSGAKKNHGEILLALSEIKNALGKDQKAYSLLKEAYIINDTLKQIKSIEAMEEMQTKFDVEEKESQLQINRLKLNERTLQRNVFLIGVSFLAACTLFVFFFFRSKIRANKKIAVQKEEIQSQRISELQQKNKVLALNGMIEGQEAERMRIAQDLHDGLGGLLSTVKAHFTSIQGETQQQQKNQLAEKTSKLIDEACIEVRRISHDMIPNALTLSSLPVALEDLCGGLKNEGYEIDLDVKDFPDHMSKTKQVVLFRIVQEAVSNIRKHADARSVLIQILKASNRLSLIIEDDGKGFDPAMGIEGEGLGLKNINSRVEFLNGSIDWNTKLSEGTTITINIPIT
ncbi:tetratricopeptide repeat-containing sensor histidine kinase [Maribacter sp.]